MTHQTDQQRAYHLIEPVYNEDSKILILGSFPSVKSREAMFFYHHPQNRFWKVLSGLFGEETPETIPERKQFLLGQYCPVGCDCQLRDYRFQRQQYPKRGGQ